MSIEEAFKDAEETGEKGLLDVTKEIFTLENKETKSDLTSKEIAIYSRALWFDEQYEIGSIKKYIESVIVLKRSLKGKALKGFITALKNMKPELVTKEGEGVGRI